MSDVIDFPSEPHRDLISEMKGAENQGCCVNLEGRRIPRLTMFDRGDEIEFVLDGRIAYSFPRAQAWDAASFAAAAMAIGAGYAHYTSDAPSTHGPFAVPVVSVDGMNKREPPQ